MQQWRAEKYRDRIFDVQCFDDIDKGVFPCDITFFCSSKKAFLMFIKFDAPLTTAGPWYFRRRDRLQYRADPIDITPRRCRQDGRTDEMLFLAFDAIIIAIVKSALS